MFGRWFRRGWTAERARVIAATPKHHDTRSAIVPYDAELEVHPAAGAPFVVRRALTVGRGQPFGVNLWVAVTVSPSRDDLEIDWERTPTVQLESGDAASKVMAAMQLGITDPAKLAELLGAAPPDRER